MKKFLLPILIMLAAIAIAAPLVASATDVFPLITCAVREGQGQGIPGMLSPISPLCTICDLFLLLQKLFQFIWLLSIPLAGVMILYGGFIMVVASFTGESSSQLTKGRKILKNAIIGLVIIFLAWIVVDSLLKILGARYGADIQELGPWNQIKCTAPEIRIFGGPVDVIPAELQCPAGVTTQIVNGQNVCDPAVQRSIVTHTSLNGARFNNCTPANIEAPIDVIIRNAAAQNRINVNRFRALILAESSGSRNVAVSRRGACGMAQVLPTTANISCASLQDPAIGIPAGAAYYAARLRECNRNESCAAAAYNGGPGANSPSRDCAAPTVRYQCPWDNQAQTIRNTGYQPTRNYVDFLNSCQAQLGG